MSTVNLSYLLSNKTAEDISNEIIDNFSKNITKENFDHDFHIQGGKMVIKKQELPDGSLINRPNTNYRFDTVENTKLRFVKDEMLRNADRLDTNQIVNFLNEIKKNLNTPESISRIRDILRKHVLNNAPDFIFPISDIEVSFFEFGEKEAFGDTLSIKKLTKDGQISQSVAAEVYRIRNETGMEYSEILSLKKKEGDPAFANVAEISVAQKSAECYLDIFADYSPVPKEAIEKIMSLK